MAESGITKRIGSMMGNQVYQIVALVVVLTLAIGGYMLYRNIKARRSGKLTGKQVDSAVGAMATSKGALAKKYGMTEARIDQLADMAAKLAFELDTHVDDKTWGITGWTKNLLGNSQREIKNMLNGLRNEAEYVVLGEFYNKVFRRPYGPNESRMMACDIAKRIGREDMAKVPAFQLWVAYMKRSQGVNISVNACK